MDSFTALIRAARGFCPVRSNKKCKNVPRTDVNKKPAVCQKDRDRFIKFSSGCSDIAKYTDSLEKIYAAFIVHTLNIYN